MELSRWLGVPLIAMSLALVACDSGDKIDTSKLEKSFSNAQPASKSALDEVKTAVSAKDCAKAGAALQKLASSTGLTPDQKQAIENVTAQVREKVAQKAKEAVQEGKKATDDLQKRLSN